MSGIYLLLQVRDAADPMRQHEIDCFQRELGIDQTQIGTFDLLSGPLPESWLNASQMILLGGSGKYSATGNEAWLEVALDSLQRVHASGIPTFASCWGFQAMARAMGGTVEHIPERAEVGTLEIETTTEGLSDPLFALCGESFKGQLGHEDFVTELPHGTTLLAGTRHAPQAFRFDGLPIYCTQFHPELDGDGLRKRLAAYPEYVELATGMKYEQLAATITDTPVAAQLLRTFKASFVG